MYPSEQGWDTRTRLEARFRHDLPQLGLQRLLSGLVGDTREQGLLFDEGWRAKQRILDTMVDAIRRLFVRPAIRRAHAMDKQTNGEHSLTQIQPSLPAAGAGLVALESRQAVPKTIASLPELPEPAKTSGNCSKRPDRA